LLVAIAGGDLITQLSWPAANPPQPLTVGIIQGNIPNEIKLYPAGWRKAIAGYRAGYLELSSQGVDAILTPETALPYQWNSLVRDRHPFYRAIEQAQVPVWVGGFGKRSGRWTNSLFAVTANGQTLSRYDKVKLVPLGEYIPFESLLGRFMGRLSPLDAMLAPGDPEQIFQTPFGDAIAGICYESAFPEHFRRQTAAGGNLILTASNNAHYSAAMPAQHHAMDVMRAIENDRWAVRATNTGYSAIVDPHGRTLWRSGLNVYAIHAETVERRTSQTPYVRWGNLFLGLFLTLTLISHGFVYYKSLLNRKK
jgi:apolipoprotein N-acyltransferase